MKERREFLLNHDEIKRVDSIEIDPDRFAPPAVTTNGPKPSIAISELLASNKKSSKDPQGDHEDWIELVNYGDDRVDLSGMYLSDDPTNMFKWRIPNGTVLEPDDILLSGQMKMEAMRGSTRTSSCLQKVSRSHWSQAKRSSIKSSSTRKRQMFRPGGWITRAKHGVS